MATRENQQIITSLRALRILCLLNLLFAAVGLVGLLLNSIGYHKLPESFIDSEAPFMVHRFPLMAVASLVLLIPLAYAGFQLWRPSRRAIVISNIVFVAEIAYFLWIWHSWKLAVSPLTLAVVASGLVNIGLALQVIIAYPVLGLIVVNLASAALSKDGWAGGESFRPTPESS